MGEAPGEVFPLDACQLGEQARGEGDGRVLGYGLEAGLLAREGVPQWAADGLVDAAWGFRVPALARDGFEAALFARDE